MPDRNLSDPVIYRWANLPDPRAFDANGGAAKRSCQIISQESTWKHVKYEWHIDCEPWEDLITAEVYVQLCGPWDDRVSAVERRAILHEAARRMEPQIRQSMNAPLVVIFQRSKTESAPGREHWHLVLPVGARMLVAAGHSRGFMKTCFFGEAARSIIDVAARFCAEAAATVLMYAPVDSGKCNSQLPDPTWSRRVVDERRAYFRRNVRFVTPANWGFESDLPGAPWQPPRAWPGAAKAATAPLPYPLNTRRKL